jgi:predicted secreted hydrolase
MAAVILLLASCAPATLPSAEVQVPAMESTAVAIATGFAVADGSRPLTFPKDFGAHEDFRTEWWYYTGNLQTTEGRHFGFELTIFRVGLVPPTVQIPSDSQWYNRNLYFAHFAVSDIDDEKFYAFERYSRPGPGLAGAQAEPYRIWIEDWGIAETSATVYHLQAAQANISVDLTLTDEMGVVLHGENGYSRKGEGADNASYYYSQPRLRTEGTVQVHEAQYQVSGFVWKDHYFSTGVLDQNQIGWDWFSLQFETGSALMLFQLREREGSTSDLSSGTFIDRDGTRHPMSKSDFEIRVLEDWRSPHTRGIYPAAWEVDLKQQNCLLQVRPWMADQELNFSTVTYWEGAVHFEGLCDGAPVHGNGYVELTGYAGDLPLR